MQVVCWKFETGVGCGRSLGHTRGELSGRVGPVASHSRSRRHIAKSFSFDLRLHLDIHLNTNCQTPSTTKWHLEKISHKYVPQLFHPITTGQLHTPQPLTHKMSTSKRALLPSTTSRPAASPRPPGPPIPPLSVSPTALLAESAQLVGTFPVTLSNESVIHPRARIDAQAGGVHVGRRCIVHERAVVGGSSSSASGRVGSMGVTLGDYVTVETGATVEAGENTVVGEGTTVGAGSVVGAGAKVGKVCVLLICV